MHLLNWRLDCEVLILIGCLALAGTCQEISINSDAVRASDRLAQERFKQCELLGTFSISRGDGSASGKFRYQISGDKFNYIYEFTKNEGFETGLHLFEAKYQVISDGKSVIVVRFSPRISTGCDSDLYSAKANYLNSCPYSPINPHFVSRLFTLPTHITDNLDRLERVNQQFAGRANLSDYWQLKFRLDPRFDFACTSCELINRETGNVTLRIDKTYDELSGDAIPKTTRESHFDADGTLFTQNILTFDKVNFKIGRAHV